MSWYSRDIRFTVPSSSSSRYTAATPSRIDHASSFKRRNRAEREEFSCDYCSSASGNDKPRAQFVGYIAGFAIASLFNASSNDFRSSRFNPAGQSDGPFDEYLPLERSYKLEAFSVPRDTDRAIITDGKYLRFKYRVSHCLLFP